MSPAGELILAMILAFGVVGMFFWLLWYAFVRKH